MSLDTFLVVLPNCLLALPPVLAIDLTSMSGRLIGRGTGTPSTVLRRILLRSMTPPDPPATPAAVAPTATAGPLALPATCFTVSIIPLLPLRLWVLRLCERPLLELRL